MCGKYYTLASRRARKRQYIRSRGFFIQQHIDEKSWLWRWWTLSADNVMQLRRNPNSLCELKTGNSSFNGQTISRIPGLRLDDAIANPQVWWDWRKLSRGLDITIVDVLENPSLPWDYQCLEYNSNIFVDNIKKNWLVLHRHIELFRKPVPTFADVLAHPHLEWSWPKIQASAIITAADIEANPQIDWEWSTLLRNPHVDVEYCIITALAQLMLSSSGWLSYRNDISIKLIKKYRQVLWFWPALSWNSNITMDDIESNINLLWHWPYVAKNPNLTISYVVRHAEELKNSWHHISANPGITMDNVKAHPELPWDYKGLSANPNMTREFMETNWDLLDLNNLCCNQLHWNDHAFARNCAKDIEARRGIVKSALSGDLAVSAVLRYIDFD
jgi:hypothetical protein